MGESYERFAEGRYPKDAIQSLFLGEILNI
jgi:hypothetical protein